MVSVAFFGSQRRTMGVAVILVLVMLLCVVLANPGSQDRNVGNATSANAIVARYRSNLELATALKNFTQRCKNISRLYTIGNSTLGVPLWALEISDKPGVSEPEPAFKFVGNMHGDEPLGRELVLLLADWLCDNYRKDSTANLIVDKMHLHLLPSMNPDGFAAKTGPTRNNAHDIDLNRDFPDQFFPQNNIEEKRQSETRGVMNWIRSTRFTASASFHEGALVANYPYDGNREINNKYAVSPDDSTFRYLAGVYASNHPLMSKSKEFPGGVTNGAAWFSPSFPWFLERSTGYFSSDCKLPYNVPTVWRHAGLELPTWGLTLEMNENKWPPPSQISEIWSEHRKSMLELVAATVTSGVHGRVMSSMKGQPLAASISISGISHSMKASVEFGDYHRLLAPGKVYEVTASMAGYLSRSTHVFLPNHAAIMLDFILDPLPDGAIIIPGAPTTESARKTAGEETPEINDSVELVVQKPTKTSRKELPVGEEMWLASGTPFRLLFSWPLVSIAAVVVCLLLRSRGSFRFHAARQRFSRV